MPKDGPTKKDRRALQMTLAVFCLVSVEVDGGRVDDGWWHYRLHG